MSWSQIGTDLEGEAAGDRYGWFLDLSSNGTIVAVGAYHNDGGGNISGHVRIHECRTVTQDEWDNDNVNIIKGGDNEWTDKIYWVQKGNDIDGAAEKHRFGTSVNLSSDGNIVAIGAYKSDGGSTDSGHVRVFEWDDTLETPAWVQKGSDIDGEAAYDWSGRITSLSSDGTIVAIGAHQNDGNGSNSGHVRVYEWDSGSSDWVQKGSDIDGESAGDNCGHFIDLSSDGTILAISSTGYSSSKGHVRVFEWNGTAWVQKGSNIDGEVDGDKFGYSLSLNEDGTILAIGGDRHNNEKGHVRVFEWNGTAWVQKGSDIDGDDDYDRLGVCVDLNNDGTILGIGINNSDGNADSCGSAKVYEWDGTAWSQIGSEIHGDDEDDRFGKSISLNSDGSVLAIGSHPLDTSINGYVRVYEYLGSTFTEFDNIFGDDSNGTLYKKLRAITLTSATEGKDNYIDLSDFSINNKNKRHNLIKNIFKNNSSKQRFMGKLSELGLTSQLSKTYINVLKPGQTFQVSNYSDNETGWYSALNNGDTITIQPTTGSTFTVSKSDDQYTLSTSGTLSVTDVTSSTYNSANYFEDDDSATVNGEVLIFGGVGSNGSGSSVPCFCTGTLIKTPIGYTSVEELKEGDEILSTNNKVLKVIYNATYLAYGSKNMPIRINHNAFGENKPSKDLYVSPNHRIPSNEGTKKAKEYVNGTTITQRKNINKVIYYNLYTEPTTDNIYANDLEVNVDNLNLRAIQYYREKEINPKKLKINYKVNINDVLKSLLKPSN